jgi:hypothetical protein
LADALSDFAHGSAIALVFERVMQQAGNCLILVTAVIEYEAGDREQMGNVGDLSSFPVLVAMEPVGVAQGHIKTCGQVDRSLLPSR